MKRALGNPMTEHANRLMPHARTPGRASIRVPCITCGVYEDAFSMVVSIIEGRPYRHHATCAVLMPRGVIGQ